MPAHKASTIIKSLLLLCIALSLTACLPKELMNRISSEQAHQEAVDAVDKIDAELAIEEDIAQASHEPSSLVGSDNVSVSALSPHVELFGSDPRGLYLLNSELAARVHNPPSLVL